MDLKLACQHGDMGFSVRDALQQPVSYLHLPCEDVSKRLHYAVPKLVVATEDFVVRGADLLPEDAQCVHSPFHVVGQKTPDAKAA
ncbi:hypothetical protein IscW_ISCW011458 [Ixodes scapularis]|uniref:Uncharacterized protein n=1 Tax=Ixodes scapularis TaxID=6945 RepID=B7Q3Y6_IXOSC|nr:hypothetical protein IscW_ISCW011458 [Ixodes scapularis]|eukprot:XP_002411417.1 hypothetical protein IscW_ISCW011458 [Ixodes scapularis]